MSIAMSGRALHMLSRLWEFQKLIFFVVSSIARMRV